MTSLGAFALVLAAGRSRRFGADKLMAPLAGTPVMHHVLRQVREAIGQGLLDGALGIIPADSADRMAQFDALGFEYIANPDPDRGLASSLRLGLETLAASHPNAGAALVILADHPRLRTEVIARLLEAARQAVRPVIRPRYAGEPGVPGHPVVLLRPVWARARALEGDHGFITMLQAEPGLVHEIDLPGENPGITTPADLQRLESSLS